MNYAKQLQNLGLKKQEAEVYLACLKLGMAKVAELAQELNIPRTSIYVYLNNLQIKGYIKKTKKAGVEYFAPLEPRFIQKEMEEKIKDFASTVPFLEKLLDFPSKKPKVEYFDTISGMTKLYEIMLDMDYKQIPYLIESGPAISEALQKLGTNFNYYWQKKFLERKIVTQGIITQSMLELTRKTPDKTKKIASQRPATVRVINDELFPFYINLYLIYSDNVFILVPQENFVIIIKNKNIYKSFVTLYQLLFAQGKPISVKDIFYEPQRIIK